MARAALREEDTPVELADRCHLHLNKVNQRKKQLGPPANLQLPATQSPVSRLEMTQAQGGTKAWSYWRTWSAYSFLQ